MNSLFSEQDLFHTPRYNIYTRQLSKQYFRFSEVAETLSITTTDAFSKRSSVRSDCQSSCSELNSNFHFKLKSQSIPNESHKKMIILFEQVLYASNITLKQV